jgi:hypothetical protein
MSWQAHPATSSQPAPHHSSGDGPTTTPAMPAPTAKPARHTARAHSRNNGKPASTVWASTLSSILAHTSAVSAPSARADVQAATPEPSAPPVPHFPPGAGLDAALASASGGALVIFGLLAFALLLAIPNAVRWLRPAVALGLTPAYVAPSDRPG